MNSKSGFFLSAAGEMRGDLSTTRVCWIRGRLRDEIRDDYMLIEIEPPLIGQAYGLGDRDITNLLISSHLQGFTLFPIREWPCHVYITRILDESITKTLVFTKGQVEMIGWGAIYRTIEEANAQAKESC